MSKSITLYTKDYCPFCHRARALLRSKGVSFTDIEIGFSQSMTQEMVKRSGGRRTVPQIFIGDQHVGGSDELVALERAGKLDALLGLSKAAA